MVWGVASAGCVGSARGKAGRAQASGAPRATWPHLQRSSGGQDDLIGGHRPLEQGPGDLEGICFNNTHQESEARR